MAKRSNINGFQIKKKKRKKEEKLYVQKVYP